MVAAGLLVCPHFSPLRGSLPAFFCFSLCQFYGTLVTVFSLVVLVVPASLALALSSAPVVGFSGSRSSVPSVASSVAALVCCPVVVGCAAGVDSFFRGAFPRARVFSVATFGSGRGAFAARSVAFVRSLATGGGVLVSFPSGACPIGLLPSASSSRAFCGSGSGSWASLAFAVGSGVQCFVFAPFGVPAGWGFVPCGGDWFSFAPASVQASLF